MLPVYIGYDSREQEAYEVCEYSLRKYASTDLDIRPLKHLDLRRMGFFDRPWRVGETGQMVDERDGQPFSTEFSFTRFLTPHLAQARGLEGWVLFVDCDFLFLDDVAKLFRLAEADKSLMVVKHQYHAKLGLKMDGVVQQPYNRKLWSSLMLFNLDAGFNFTLSMRAVNWQPGSWLHGLRWVPDDKIGSIPESWNFIPNHSRGTPNAVHFTEGGPWMRGYEHVPYAEMWREHYENAPTYGSYV
jgi:lipopolysaccharide biosynthesis glycosyltransferase